MGSPLSFCLLSFVLGSFAHAVPVAPLRGDVVGSDEPAPAVYRGSTPPPITRVFDENVGVETSTKPLPDAPGINITPETAAKYGADFDNVIVVNKSPDENGEQWVTVYRYKQREDGHRVPLADFPKTYKMSTGREIWRCEDKLDANRKPTGEAQATWLGTPTGFYVPFSCEAIHVSMTYNDAKMRNACFFNHLGIAIHKPDVSEPGPNPSDERMKRYQKAVAGQLHARSSHGCVRTEAAKLIQLWIIESGPTPSGDYMQTYLGKLKELLANPSLTKSERAEFQNKLEESIALVNGADAAGLQDGQGPYNEQTTVPDLDVATGKYKHGADGQVSMVKAPRSLVVVECITPAGKDCSTTQRTLDKGKAALDCTPAKAVAPPETIDPFSAFVKSLFGG